VSGFGESWSVIEGQVASCGAWCDVGQPHQFYTFDVMHAT
jgi:hypothetical protein